MATKIAIIGLGQIGASMGLALKSRSNGPTVVGWDKDGATRRAAEDMGAVDSVAGMVDAAKSADIVLLCLPLSEIRDVLRRVGPVMREDAVLLDTAPAKGPVIAWLQESLPAGRHYVGIVPAVDPEFLAAPESGIKGASADLFRRAVMIIAAPPNTPAEVEQLAVNLCSLLGAKALLADLAESDGLMAATHLMPQLTAAALMEAAEAGTGWAEARKIAGRPFAAITGGAAYFDDAASLEIAALVNQPALVHALDVLIATLTGMRQEILDGDEKGVAERLQHSFHARERWLDERGAAEWLGQGADAVEIPELGEQMMRAIFGGRIVDRNKPKKKKPDQGPSAGGSRR